MTINDYIQPMRYGIQKIYFLVYPGFELLDLAGPSSVFEMANTVSGNAKYCLEVISPQGGLIKSGCGITIKTKPINKIRISRHDTILVVGAEKKHLRVILKESPTFLWLKKSSQISARFGSVCTGAFILATCGLLDSKHATTHWEGRSQFSKSFPKVILEADKLYVQDGNLWTSAGVSTGIDMSLAIVESDLGTSIKTQIAKRLVIYSHRKGNQTQFSDVLLAQEKEDKSFSFVVDWINLNLAEKVLVEDLAAIAGMSLRNFHRRFKEKIGLSPSIFLINSRLNRAKELLEAG